MFHPSFAPLHARLTGMPDEMARVSGHTLLSLYPVEVESYAPFLTTFYSRIPRADLHDQITDSYFEFAHHIGEVEAFSVNYYPRSEWSSYVSFVENEIEQKVGDLADDLTRLAGGDDSCSRALAHQLSVLLRLMRLSSNLLDSTCELVDEAHLTGFSKGAERLNSFFATDNRV